MKDPLSNREALVIIERVYDHILDLEHLRREQPSEEDEEAYAEWWVRCDNLPLETMLIDGNQGSTP